MKVVKQESEFGLDTFFKEEKKYLAITYMGNLDLYWSIHSVDVNKDNEFIITNENYEVYKLFNQLFYDIRNMRNSEDEYYKNEIDFWNSNKVKFDSLFLPFYAELNNSKYKEQLINVLPFNFFRIIEYQENIT